MRAFITTLAAFCYLLSFQEYASGDDTSLKGFLKPVYEFVAGSSEGRRSGTPACFGGYDPHGLPFVGSVNPKTEACEYLYKQSGSTLSQKKVIDGAHAEWLDISYDDLLQWLQRKATKLVDRAKNEQYFMFTYGEITGSVSTLHQRKTVLCARWVNESQLVFGYLMPIDERTSSCISSGDSSYAVPTRSWQESFDQISNSAWCADTHDLGFCTATTDSGADSVTECAQAAIAKTGAAGFCYDGATCCHITDKLNENDTGGGSNKCWLKKGRNKGDFLVRCQKTPFN